jgi:F-type H+-transporting ATPase subunit b
VESQLNAKLEAAEDRIQADREQAMTHVRAIAAETAAAMVEKLTGLAGSTAELEAAIVSAAGRTN